MILNLLDNSNNNLIMMIFCERAPQRSVKTNLHRDQLSLVLAEVKESQSETSNLSRTIMVEVDRQMRTLYGKRNNHLLEKNLFRCDMT